MFVSVKSLISSASSGSDVSILCTAGKEFAMLGLFSLSKNDVNNDLFKWSVWVGLGSGGAASSFSCDGGCGWSVVTCAETELPVK